MKALHFTTTINCGGIKAVAPALNQEAGIGNWRVDTANSNKSLPVASDALTAAQVVVAV